MDRDIIQTQVNSFNPAFQAGRPTSVNPMRSLNVPASGAWRADPINPPYAGSFGFCDYDTGYVSSTPSGGTNVVIGFVMADNPSFLAMERGKLRLEPGFAIGVMENVDAGAWSIADIDKRNTPVFASLYDGSVTTEAEAPAITATASIAEQLMTVTGTTSSGGAANSLPVGSIVTGTGTISGTKITANHGDGTYSVSNDYTSPLAATTLNFTVATATNATAFSTCLRNNVVAISLIGAAARA